MSLAGTRKEHFHFLCEMVALQLWFLRHWLADHPEEDFSHVMRKRINVYRRTDLYDGRPIDRIDYDEPTWRKLEDATHRLCEETMAGGDATRFETEGLAIFLEHIAARADLDAQRSAGRRLANFQCGSLRFDPPHSEHPTRVPFHIANAVQPESIFDGPAYLPGCLHGLIEKSRRQYGADSLSTATWLNSYPKWLRLFPPQWIDHLGPEMTEPTIGMGFWGQFINARGTFNARRARILRETGSFPFWPRASWCTFDQLTDHLEQLGYLR